MDGFINIVSNEKENTKVSKYYIQNVNTIFIKFKQLKPNMHLLRMCKTNKLCMSPSGNNIIIRINIVITLEGRIQDTWRSFI